MSAEVFPTLIAEARAAVRWRIPNTTPVKGTPLNVRLFARLDIVGDCWEFRGHRDPSGYGRLVVNERWSPAHRIAWELVHGPIADPELCVCHHCDNRVCCNPDHLFLGTRLDNNRDRHAKGRTVLPDPGEARGRAQRERTHCPRNHPYDEANTRYDKRGWRKCITCLHASQERRAARKREAKRVLKAA